MSGASRTVGVAYCVAFLLARLAHTVAYLRRRPRLRRDAFTAEWLTTLGMGPTDCGSFSQAEF